MSLRPFGMEYQAAPHGLEVLLFESDNEPLAHDIRRAWSDRRAGRITPVLVMVFYPTPDGERASLCGPTDHQMVYRAVEVSRVRRLARAALDESDHHAATRLLKKELPELGTSIAGLRSVGLLTAEMLTEAIPEMTGWEAAVERAVPLLMSSGPTLVERLGYSVEPLGTNTRKLTAEGRSLAVGVFCNETESFDEPAIRLGGVSPTSFALMVAKEQQVDWALLTRTSEIRLCSSKEERKFVEINLDLLRKDQAGYLDLMFSVDALKNTGTLSQILGKGSLRPKKKKKEAPMIGGRTFIGCIGGETIELERHAGETILTIDDKAVKLSQEATGLLIDWLVSRPVNKIVIDRPSPKPRKKKKKRNRRKFEGTVYDLVRAGLIEPGTILTLTYKGNDYKSKVLAKGRLEIAGQQFDAPSGAGKFATGTEINGWKEWKTPDGHALRDLREEMNRRENNG